MTSSIYKRGCVDP